MSKSHKSLHHGGDLAEARAALDDNAPDTDWLDLSTGINQFPYPIPEINCRYWTELPSKEEEAKLDNIARRYYSVPQGAGLVIAPGSQSLIQILPSLFPNLKVSILGPTYEEHEASWCNWGHAANIVKSLREASDIAIVVNPNNPDGRIIEADELADAAQFLSAKNGWLIVDEAFADTTPEISAAKLTDTTNTIVLKSVGKFFGLPGLRLGFAITPREIASKLKIRLGPWPVSGPALVIGRAALSDQAWQTRTRKALENDSIRLNYLLQIHGLKFVGGTNLFSLVQSGNAEGMFNHLLKNHIYVRRFPQWPHWLRFAIPRSTEDYVHLENALETFGD